MMPPTPGFDIRISPCYGSWEKRRTSLFSKNSIFLTFLFTLAVFAGIFFNTGAFLEKRFEDRVIPDLEPQPTERTPLTDRVVLSPFAAKRLSLLLNAVVADYEKKFGQLEIGVQRPEGSTVQ